jgi:small-conductance mechanosensitive channel/CRP-like cAMP-binding protein
VPALICLIFPHLKLGAAGEIFGVSIALYLLLVSTGRLLKKRLGTRLGAVYQMFCAIVAPYVAIAISQPSILAFEHIGRHLASIAVLLGTGVFVRLLDQYFWRGYLVTQRKTSVPKFVREVAAVFIMALACVLVLQFGYNTPVPAGLLGASGVGAIILGFALQDLLGNIIAGFAIQIGRPFQVGDWLLLDNQHVQAIEINWRSTRFVTNDEVQIDVPNQQIVRGTIVNYHGGGALHGMRFEIGIDYNVPPNRVREVLIRAMAAAHGVKKEPKPYAFLKSFGDSAVIYEVRFWLDDHRQFNMMSDAVKTNIWYALRRENISMPYPIRTLHIERHSETARAHKHKRDPRESIAELLRGQRLFKSMASEHLQRLVDRSPVQRYGAGEVIIREGAEGSSMFVLVTGEAGVHVTTGGQPTRVATLRGGDCFGEMSLLTGESRSASVQAVNDCEVMEITKPVFADIIQLDGDLLSRLSELLARRQIETDDIVQARASQPSLIAAKEQEYRAGFLHKLKSFFEL